MDAWLIYLDAGFFSPLLKASPDDSGMQPRFRIPDLKCMFPKSLADPEFLKYIQAYFSRTEH